MRKFSFDKLKTANTDNMCISLVMTQDFSGNTDSHSIVYHGLNPPIKAKIIRFRPRAWHGHISMRVELYGCPVKGTE